MIKEFIFAPGISVRKFSTIKSPPKPRKTSEKRDAPIIILVSLSVDIGHIYNIGTSVKSIILTNIILALISVLELATSALISVTLAFGKSFIGQSVS